MSVFVGIDPGLDGAAAVMVEQGEGRPLVDIFDTPTLAVAGKNGRSTRRDYNLPAMAQFLLRRDPETTLVAVEEQQAFPGQGVRSMFMVGAALYGWLGILAALEIPHQRVRPQLWRRELLPGMPKGKESSVLRALDLFPWMSDLLTKSKHGRAEALLLAEFARRTHGR